MATKRQTEANRENAQKSTGPKTEAGKAASSANALRHGLTAELVVVLPDEDADAFERLRAGVIADLAAKGALQEVLAERAAVLLWRLDRIARMEAELFVHGDLALDRTSLVKDYTEAMHPMPFVDQLGDKAKAVRDEFEKRLIHLDASMYAEAPCARVLVQRESSARAFDQIARHEAMLQRALHRTLDEFRRLQGAAPAKPEPEAPPAAKPEPAPDAASGPEPAPSRAVRQRAPQDRRPSARKPHAEVARNGKKEILQNEANSGQAVEGAPDSGSGANPSTAPPVA